MNQLRNKTDVAHLSFLFMMTYMVSYITRINYGAIISAMESAMSIPRSQISIAVTGSFFTYGIGQIVSGICGDKFSPKKLILYGLIATVCMNLFIPFCVFAWQMLIVWCINGFVQSFMWPPMVRIMTALLSEDDYNKVIVRVSWGSSFGTIAIYAISPLLISLFSWKAVFFFSAICGIIMAFIWNRYSYEIPQEPKKSLKSEKLKTKKYSFLSPLMVIIMIPIVIQGMLKDGITTWMPTYISETYNLESMISILTGVTLPVLAIVWLQITSKVYDKIFKNPILCSGVIFGVATAVAFGLMMLSGINPVLSIIMTAFFVGCMHGVNLMFTCILPIFFKNSGNVSTVSGILNFFSYVGSAISTYGTAVISEKFGWSYTLFFWMLISAVGSIICFVCTKPWDDKISDI